MKNTSIFFQLLVTHCGGVPAQKVEESIPYHGRSFRYKVNESTHYIISQGPVFTLEYYLELYISLSNCTQPYF